MIKDLELIYFGPERWAGMWRNRHQLLSRLARANRVVYVEPRPMLRHVVRDLQRGRLSPADLFAGGLAPTLDGLWTYRTPLYAAIGGGPLWRPLARMLRVRHLRSALVSVLGSARRPLVWLSHPSQANARGDLAARLRIYHVVDEYLAYPGAVGQQHAWLETWENQIIAWADLIIAVTPELIAAKGRGRTGVHLLPNAADLNAFQTAVANPVNPQLHRPVIGFSGLISARVDLRSLAEASARRPAWSWVLVGDVVSQGCERDLAELRSRPNVHFLGARPAAEVPAIVAGWDVGLVPYKVNDESRHASPLKLYEYLAAGLPVVGVDIPAVRQFAEFVEIIAIPDELPTAIERALAGDDAAARVRRRAAVRGHSWDDRVETLSEILVEALNSREKGAL